MKIRGIFLILLIINFLCNCVVAQFKYDYNWMYANAARPMRLSFQESFIKTKIDTPTTQISIGSSNTTMSDSTGNLLFYSNGCKIYNAQHKVIKDGEGLNPGSETGSCPDYNTAGNQSMASIPHPSVKNWYYIFYEYKVFIYEPKFRIGKDHVFFI